MSQPGRGIVINHQQPEQAPSSSWWTDVTDWDEFSRRAREEYRRIKESKEARRGWAYLRPIDGLENPG